MGGDQLLSMACFVFDVSIHAPAWGATGKYAKATSLATRFQSTPPHGGRHRPLKPYIYQESFNPRPRMGGDPMT